MKIWNHLILGVILAVLVSPCISGQSVQQAGLDEVIQNAAKRVEEGMPQGTMVAVLNFTSTSETFSDYVIEELTGELVRGRKLTIVDRRRLALIRQEMNLQLSGDISDESASAIGRQLGAQSIVSGSLTNMGTYFRFRVSVINVETSAIEYQTSLNLRSDPQVTFLLSSDPPRVAANAPASTSETTRAGTVSVAPSTTPAQTVYKVGDAGPAGGIVFYDKGNNSGGWRYLEAAPATMDTTAQFRHNSGPLGEVVRAWGQTSKELGSGYTNTQNIMRFFNQNGGGFGLAVQVSNELTVNSFNDWFLPSQDELSYMYGNLHRRGLGGFRSEWYYSSTLRSNDSYPVRINFANGEPDYGNSGVSRRVRAVRRF